MRRGLRQTLAVQECFGQNSNRLLIGCPLKGIMRSKSLPLADSVTAALHGTCVVEVG